MQDKEFMILNQKRGGIKPFLQIYQAQHQNDINSNHLVQIYSLSKISNPTIKEALQFNQCVFTENYQLPTDNIVLIQKVEETQNFCAIYIDKYDKNLQQYIKDKKKGRVPEHNCIKIMHDVLKGLCTLLQTGYRPVAIRADSIVRYLSKNPQQKQDTWKIKNIVYSSKFALDKPNNLTFQQTYSPPEIYSRKNLKDMEYNESDQYKNSLLVWSLGILLAKLLGIQNKLNSKKKLSQFMDRQFNIMDILYIRNQYSADFLMVIGSMLHFNNKKRMKLKDLLQCKIFKEKSSSEKISRISSEKSEKSEKSLKTSQKSQQNTAELTDQVEKSDKDSSISSNNSSEVVKQSSIWTLHCSLFQFQKVF